MKKFLILIFCCFVCFPLHASTDVIHEVFFNLNKEYVNEKSNQDIALKGLQSLNSVDKDIDIKTEGNELSLYQKGILIKKIEMPTDEKNTNLWVDFSKQIINEAIQVSKKLEVLDFELPDRFAASVFEDLDGYSHYFGAFDEKDESKPLKFKRPFASRLIDDVLLIRVLSFQKDISLKVKNAVEECSKCTGVILDLRGNNGGFFDEAIKIANMFLDEGIIAYTLSDENASPEYYTAEAGDILQGRPIVILVDGQTASASEVLAAALSEQNRAVLIGTKTYGKGTVQDVQKMGNDRAMAVTTTFFHTPSGLKIDKIGLTPFICVVENENCEKEDRLHKEEDIDRAVQYLKTGL